MLYFITIAVKIRRLIAKCKVLLKENKSAVLSFLIAGILVDIVFTATKSDIVIFGILTVYILAIIFYKLNSKTTFSICFIILAALFLEFTINGATLYAEKAAVWLFLITLIGILQELFSKKDETA